MIWNLHNITFQRADNDYVIKYMSYSISKCMLWNIHEYYWIFHQIYSEMDITIYFVACNKKCINDFNALFPSRDCFSTKFACSFGNRLVLNFGYKFNCCFEKLFSPSQNCLVANCNCTFHQIIDATNLRVL